MFCNVLRPKNNTIVNSLITSEDVIKLSIMHETLACAGIKLEYVRCRLDNGGPAPHLQLPDLGNCGSQLLCCVQIAIEGDCSSVLTRVV